MSTKGPPRTRRSSVATVPPSTRAKSNNPHQRRNNGIPPKFLHRPLKSRVTGTTEPFTHVGKQHTTQAPKGHWGRRFLSHGKVIVNPFPVNLGVRTVKVLVWQRPSMTRRSPWCNQQESASWSGLGRGFHRKSAENPPKRRAWTPPAPQIEPHHRGATAHTTQNHRGSSSSHRSAPSLRHPKARSGVRWPSTNHEEAPRSVLPFVAQKLLSSHTNMGSGSAVTAHAVR